MRTAYIVDILRTPIGKYGGTLASTRPDDLATHMIQELINRAVVGSLVKHGATIRCGNFRELRRRNQAMLFAMLGEVCRDREVSRLAGELAQMRKIAAAEVDRVQRDEER